MAVEIREMAELRQLGEEARRVVAEQDHLRPLQRHDAVGFGPAAVVAEAPADDAVHPPSHRESQIARLEIALLEMLQVTRLLVLYMAGTLHRAVLADSLASAVNQNGTVQRGGPPP